MKPYVKRLVKAVTTLSLLTFVALGKEYYAAVRTKQWSAIPSQEKRKIAYQRHLKNWPSDELSTEAYEKKYGLNDMRKVLCSYAQGNVLQVCGGAARNIPYLPADGQVRRLVITDYLKDVVASQGDRVSGFYNVDYTFDDITHSRMPSSLFDTVISTFGLQYVPEVGKALAQMRRVCKPGGLILLLEQGKSYAKFSDGVLGLREQLSLKSQGQSLDRDWGQLVSQQELQVIYQERVYNGKFWLFVLRKPL